MFNRDVGISSAQPLQSLQFIWFERIVRYQHQYREMTKYLNLQQCQIPSDLCNICYRSQTKLLIQKSKPFGTHAYVLTACMSSKSAERPILTLVPLLSPNRVQPRRYNKYARATHTIRTSKSLSIMPPN